MCKKNVKWYLKDTDKTISIGDEVTFNQSISFTKYPNMEFETSVTHPIDAEDLKILEDSDIVEKKEVQEIEPYEVYIKWLADVKGFKYSDVYNSFSVTKAINPNAALSILLKAISKKMNKSYNKAPNKVWIYNLTTGKPTIIDVTSDIQLNGIAWFMTKEDLDYALKVCKPILK